MLAFMAQMSAIFGGMGGGRDRGGNIIGLLVIAIVMPLVAVIVRLAISRAREFQADRTGALTSGSPLVLASALAKLHEGSKAKPMELSQERLESVSHLFIVNPLKGGGMSRLFSTHPPMEERIRRLQAMEGQGSWPAR